MRILTLLLFSCLTVVSYAEDDFLIQVLIKEVYTEEKLGDAEIEIRKDNQSFETFTTNEHGNVEFRVPLDHGYHFYFKKKGFVTKFIMIDTRNISEEDKIDGFKVDLDITLFHFRKGFNRSVMENPLGIAKYDPTSNSIEFDFDYTASVIGKIEAEQNRTDSLYQKRFSKAMSKAKKQKVLENDDKALKWYRKAFKYIPSDETVRKKLGLILDEPDKIKV